MFVEPALGYFGLSFFGHEHTNNEHPSRMVPSCVRHQHQPLPRILRVGLSGRREDRMADTGRDLERHSGYRLSWPPFGVPLYEQRPLSGHAGKYYICCCGYAARRLRR